MRLRRVMGAGAAGLLAVSGLAATMVTGAVPAGADTITVTNTADDGSDTSLRYLVQTANAGDVIELVPGATYQLTRCEVDPPEAGAQIVLSTGQLLIFEPVTINGNGATIRQTCDGYRVILSEESLTLDGVTITGGTSNGGGGGVRIDSGILSTGDAPLPQGDFPTLIIRNSSIVGNCSTGSGGGFKMNTDGEVEIYNSTIADNEADDNGGGLSHSHVGSVYMENSTVTNNAARFVGGIEVRNGDFTAVYSDVVDNSLSEGTNCDVAQDAEAEEDPVPQDSLAPANLLVDQEGSRFSSFGTVVALHNGSDVNCVVFDTDSAGYNFSDDMSCGFDQATDSQTTGAEPQLGALAANGGPTSTRLPAVTSPLVDAIPAAACSAGDALAGHAITVDQRYLARPDVVGQKCDIGAVELQTEAVALEPNFTG